MRRLISALSPAGPSLVLTAVVAVLALGSGGVLIVNEINARDGERSSFQVEHQRGERFDEVVRVRTDGNAGTSVAFSRMAFPDDGSAGTVVIGRDDVFADNLAAGLLQSQGPLLLTDPARLNATVRDEILRLGATRARIVGGPKAISPEVEAELAALGLGVTRLAGPTRIETALAIADAGLGRARSALLVRARDAAGGDSSQAWADSLAAGAYAAAAGVPVLLTDSAALHPAVAAWLARNQITRVHAIGGRSAISDAALHAAAAHGAVVDRIAGSERAETAIAVAQDLWGFSGSHTAKQIVLVDGYAGDSWAAGVVAASYARRHSAPLVLANGENIPPATEQWIEQGGGTLVCSSSVRDDACQTAAAPPPDGQQGSASPTPSASPGGPPSGTPSPPGTPPPPPPNPKVVSLTNTRPGEAMFTLTNMLPGDQAVRRIGVRNNGDYDLKVRLHGRVSGGFASALTLRVVADPDGSATQLYDGTLRNFAQQHPAYPHGVGEWFMPVGGTRLYEFTVRLPEGVPFTDYDQASATFVWEGRT